MEKSRRPRIIYLGNIHDQHYHDLRGEPVERCLTIPYRSDLMRCLEDASGLEVVLLSLPPKALERRAGKWLPAMETRFVTHRQLFCANWDIPKLRVPLAWFFYARHVLHHVRSGDVVVMDNYEFLYVIAARIVWLFRRVKFVIVYLDGKYLIDRGWARLLSWTAETLGRPLMNGAILSNPILEKRLSDSTLKELAPGFVPEKLPVKFPAEDEDVHFLYAGGLAHSHGTDLLIEALPFLPEHGWHLVIAGQGTQAELAQQIARDPRWRGKVEYRSVMPSNEFAQLLDASHVGLNCQRISTPISSVTFPSKIFTYLSAGLLVISSKSGCVESICRDGCLYYEEETPRSLAAVMTAVIADSSAARKKVNPATVSDRFSFEALSARIRKMFQQIGVTK
jgi:glycosyltransferase involved in cell wall biosynthesis